MSKMKNELDHDKVFEFIIAGNCNVVIHNETTDAQRKFLIKARYIEPKNPHAKIDKHKMENIMCYYLHDSSKGFKKNSGYLGTINKETMKFFEKGSQDMDLSRNFAWFWHNVIEKTLPLYIHVLHLGQCSFCGRPLKDAFSLERGIGPVCYSQLFSAKPINNEHIKIPAWGPNRSTTTDSSDRGNVSTLSNGKLDSEL